MPVQHVLNRRPVAFGWRDDAARAKHRLADEGGNRVSALAVYQCLQRGNAMRNERLLALIGIGAAEVVGRLRMNNLGQRQVELLVKQLQPRQRAGHPAPSRDSPASAR